jgi:hypothetical protein
MALLLHSDPSPSKMMEEGEMANDFARDLDQEP